MKVPKMNERAVINQFIIPGAYKLLVQSYCIRTKLSQVTIKIVSASSEENRARAHGQLASLLANDGSRADDLKSRDYKHNSQLRTFSSDPEKR